MKQTYSVCVIIPVKNRVALTKRFLSQFSKSTYKNYQIVIINDASTDYTQEEISKLYPQVVILKGDGQLWWTGATNMGVRYALQNNFDYILTINNDAQIKPDFLNKLMTCSQKHPNSIIGSLILRDDNKKIWSVGGHLEWDSDHLFNLNFSEQDCTVLQNFKEIYKVEILNGNGTLFPIKIFQKIGLYNFFFTPHYHADSEIVLRAQKYGYPALVCLDAILLNHISFEPNVIGRKNIIFSHKSDYFWRPLIYFYLKYGKKKYFFNFFKQYSRFFQDFSLIDSIKRHIHRIFEK